MDRSSELRAATTMMEPKECLAILHHVAGPPIPRDWVLSALDKVQQAHELDPDLCDEIKKEVVSRYPR